jgi:hypothetical protein
VTDLLHVVGGLVVFAASLYMLKRARVSEGATAPALKSGLRRELYLYAVLLMFFGGAMWAVWGVTRLF